MLKRLLLLGFLVILCLVASVGLISTACNVGFPRINTQSALSDSIFGDKLTGYAIMKEAIAFTQQRASFLTQVGSSSWTQADYHCADGQCKLTFMRTEVGVDRRIHCVTGNDRMAVLVEFLVDTATDTFTAKTYAGDPGPSIIEPQLIQMSPNIDEAVAQALAQSPIDTSITPVVASIWRDIDGWRITFTDSGGNQLMETVVKWTNLP